jgi:hypothetical protein
LIYDLGGETQILNHLGAVDPANPFIIKVADSLRRSDGGFKPENPEEAAIVRRLIDSGIPAQIDPRTMVYDIGHSG